MQGSVCLSCISQQWGWLAHVRQTHERVLSVVTCSGVTLTCIAGLLLGSPPHLHRPLTACHLPPSPQIFNCIPVLHLSLSMSSCLTPPLSHFYFTSCSPAIRSFPSPLPSSQNLSFASPFSLIHPSQRHTPIPLVFDAAAAAAVTQRYSAVCRCDHYATSPTPLEYWWAAGLRQQRDSEKQQGVWKKKKSLSERALRVIGHVHMCNKDEEGDVSICLPNCAPFVIYCFFVSQH